MENDDYEIEGWGGSSSYSHSFLNENNGFFSVRKLFETIKKYHHQQIVNKDISTPSTKSIQELKDLFKGFFLDKSVHVFEFLTTPIKTQETLKNTLKLLDRIQKKNLPIYNSIEDLILNTDMEEEKKWLESKLNIQQQKSSSSSIEIFNNYIQIYIQLWKESVGELFNHEKELLDCLFRFESIQKKVDIVMELPENPASNELFKSLETYVNNEFENSCLCIAYNNCITTYKKIYLLKELISILHTFKNENAVPFCMVCFTNHISMAFVPCGHTFCEDCTSRVSNGYNCFVCRQTITHQQKLYFS